MLFCGVLLFVTPWTVAYQLLCPWDSRGKNTGVGCDFLLRRKMKAWVFISFQLAPSRELCVETEAPLQGGVLLWQLMLVQLVVSYLSLSLSQAFCTDYPVRVWIVWRVDDLLPRLAYRKPQPQHQQLALLLGLSGIFQWCLGSDPRTVTVAVMGRTQENASQRI